MTQQVPQDVIRYIRETRLANGRPALESFLETLRDQAVKTAIYGADPNTTGIQKGRAQAWAEILNLFRHEKL